MSQATPPHPPESSTIAWTDAGRALQFNRWLSELAPGQCLKVDTLRPASADASFRRYFRIDSAQGSRIIMDAPPERENSQPFVMVAKLMQEAHILAPEVLAWDQVQGFMLLSDLGERTMMQVIDRDNAHVSQSLYLQAVDSLIAWQLASKPGVLPPYDEALLRRELALFPDWYLSKHHGIVVEGDILRTLDTTFKQIISQNLSWPSVYVHRDFMPRNLMIADPPPQPSDVSLNHGNLRLGVLDFQDAVFGPITYDIASLMRDAFLSWDEDFCLDITIRYWEKARQAGLPVGADFGEFYRGVEWMGLQRHLKVAGIFARLTLRDGKPQYLADAPRFITYIRATCERYRELKPLLRLVEKIEGIEVASGYAFGRV